MSILAVEAGVSSAFFVNRSRHGCLYRRLLFFAIEVIGLRCFNDHFIVAFFHDRELAAVGIMTSVAAGIIGNHVVNEIFFTVVAELVRLARPEEKRIAWPDLRPAVLVANFSPP